MRKRRWDKQQLSNTIQSSLIYRQVLSKIGLRQAGGNYQQIRKYVQEYGFNVSHFKGRG